MPPTAHAPLADPGSCHGRANDTALDPVCTFVRDHLGGEGGGEAAVFLVGRVVWPILLFALVVLASRLVRNFLDHAAERAQLDAQVRTLVHNAALLAGYVVAVGAALVGVGLDLSIFLTLGGLSTLVVGLAFQDLLRNIVAGTFLLVDRPFRIGDVITVDGVTGTVLTIELRTTELRLADGTLAVIPNLDVFTKRVVNLTAYDLRQFSVSVWVPVDVDLEAVVSAFQAELEAEPEVRSAPPPNIQPGVTIDGGVTLAAQYWLPFRECNPDLVSARLVRRLAGAADAIGGGRDWEPPPPRPADTTPSTGDDQIEGKRFGVLTRAPHSRPVSRRPRTPPH